MTTMLSVVLLASTLAAFSEPTNPRDIALALTLGDTTGEGWQASDLRITISLPYDGPGALQLQLAELTLTADGRRFEDVQLDCFTLALVGSSWLCEEGTISASSSPVGKISEVHWAGGWDDRAGLKLTLDGLPLAGGELFLKLEGRRDSWAAKLEFHRLGLRALVPLVPEFQRWRDWNLSGRLSGSMEVKGAGDGLRSLSAKLKLGSVEFASADGLQAAEDFALEGRLGAERRDAAWDLDMGLSSEQGRLYFDPVFVDASANGLQVQGRGRWSLDKRWLDIDRWSLVHADTVEAEGNLRLLGQPPRLRSAYARVRSANLHRLYQRWLQPFLIGSLVEDLTLQGGGSAQVEWDTQGPVAVELQFDDLTAREQARRFAIEGVSGVWYWHREVAAATSQLQVAGASLYRFVIGPFHLAFNALGSKLELVQPLVLPLLDGAIRIARLRADTRADQLRAEASVVIEELDLEALTAVLQWPRFRGVLSGRLPNVSYENGVIRTNDRLSFSAFDGEVHLKDLVIRDAFGVLPVLEGSAELRGLDLAALTEVFSFGRIEGRLNGELLNLELLGWQPNRFDLHLYTPRGSKARRRISQRAVENLTELGTGIPGGLSATLLKVFDEFRYEIIDIRIGLKGDTAELDGLDAPDGGYYLVRGSGLPRIDVIGKNRQVGWKDLIRRLRNIRLEGAEVK